MHCESSPLWWMQQGRHCGSFWRPCQPASPPIHTEQKDVYSPCCLWCLWCLGLCVVVGSWVVWAYKKYQHVGDFLAWLRPLALLQHEQPKTLFHFPPPPQSHPPLVQPDKPSPLFGSRKKRSHYTCQLFGGMLINLLTNNPKSPKSWDV